MMEKEQKKVLDRSLDIESRNLSEKYLNKYWLNIDELTNFWLPIK